MKAWLDLKMIIFIMVFFTGGCESSDPFQPSPKMLAHALAQNKEGIKEEAEKQQDKMKEILRIPDPNRRLARAQTLNVVNDVSGVKFSRWLNRSTILIQPSAYFAVSTLDDSCAALEAIGDSRWVIVAVEIHDGTTTSLQWQNCHLPKGEVALGSIRPKIQ